MENMFTAVEYQNVESIIEKMAHELDILRKKEEIYKNCLEFDLNRNKRILKTEEEKIKQSKKLNLNQACKCTGLNYHTFYDKIQSDKIKCAHFGKKIIFDIADISKYILSRKVGDWSILTCTDDDVIFGDKVDIKGCSKITGLCYDTFYTNMVREDLPHIRYGHKRIFLKKFIEEWTESKFLKAE